MLPYAETSLKAWRPQPRSPHPFGVGVFLVPTYTCAHIAGANRASIRAHNVQPYRVANVGGHGTRLPRGGCLVPIRERCVGGGGVKDSPLGCLSHGERWRAQDGCVTAAQPFGLQRYGGCNPFGVVAGGRRGQPQRGWCFCPLRALSGGRHVVAQAGANKNTGVAQVVPRYCLFLCPLASRRMVIKTAPRGAVLVWTPNGEPIGGRNWVPISRENGGTKA